MGLRRAIALLLSVAVSGACLGTPPSSATATQEKSTNPVSGGARANPADKDGPNAITRKIIEDAHGVLWLATFHGAFRYDREKFTRVTHDAGLKGARVFSLLRDQANNIWLGTLGSGAYRYDGTSYTNLTTRDGLASDRVLFMMEDDAGNIWLGFEGAGATRYDGTTFASFGKKDGFTDGDVSSIVQAPTGRIWFGTREGLFHYDGTSFVNFSVKAGLSTGGYIPTLVDRRGHLWFGGAHGLHHYDGVRLRQVTESASWALMEEESTGHIWFGGDAPGPPRVATLSRVDPRTVAGDSEPAVVRVASSEGMFFDVFKDSKGNVWVGTLRGMGRLEGDTVRH